MNSPISRRSAITKLAGTAASIAAAAALSQRLTAADNAVAAAAPDLKGHINHSVCAWCYKDVPLEELCKSGKEMGLQSVELLEIKDIPTLKKHDLICAMVSGVPGGITSGLNRLENHDKIVTYFEENLPKVAEAGFPNMICFSGNRKGMSDEQGLENCAMGLKRIMSAAEKHKVTLCMELLNSKVNHHDYMCDLSKWGVELCKKVGSDRFKLLYDIYHMQIMEGDVIHTIKDNHQYFGHYHTGGVPGRHEIDDSQELYYPAIMKAIIETGFKGHVAQEFIPARQDVLASLKQGVQICDV
ncbi:hydroxypyruvate isomerase family protein [Pedosphaera parvula]|uniref:Xylose isomerase domain protein TIM barrel n=1 Tax=Pedosphaera parvula (strain Ellin514) TaxID=320771 RepID=B9XFS4_PEDPL|nr:TIM barrel protein [Pedosphaera parvula]EEF61438.1 Xylose isomerase domain protein TIM barrel [Pedosphaera parvula Ellin514]